MIYFDNSATTKIDPRVLKTYNAVSNEFWANPSSLHGLGFKAYNLLNKARNQIASIVNVLPSEIYFTSGGTESNNTAIKGVAFSKRKNGKHIITTSIEHSSVLRPMHQLEKLGYKVTYLPVNEKGFIEIDDLKKSITPDTILVSVMAVNNEIGSIQNIHDIGEILRKYPNICYHVDAVQAVGKGLENRIFNTRVDLASFSSHKFHGPIGVGILYIRNGIHIEPLIDGGGQEFGMRSGTENLPGIVAMSKAFRLELENSLKSNRKEQDIKLKILNHIKNFKNVSIFSGTDSNFVPNILCFAINGIRGEVIVRSFEKEGIYISTTSACSSKDNEASETLKSMKIPLNIATSSVRISLDNQNTLEEADKFNSAFDKIYHHFEKISFKSS